jgi:hypothetical protein
LHRALLRDGEWIRLRGLLVTRLSRIAADLLSDQEDPQAVAHVVADALRPVHDDRAPSPARLRRIRLGSAFRMATGSRSWIGFWILPAIQSARRGWKKPGSRSRDGWILNGATALLARHIAVRHTVDVDVYRTINHRQAENDLRAAMNLDAADWFNFESGRAVPIADAAAGRRVPVVARLRASE